MAYKDWNLEANEERGQLQALREEKFLEDCKEEQWQKKQEGKCQHCGADLPRDLAFQNAHLENCRGNI
jgi:hypothetical protein